VKSFPKVVCDLLLNLYLPQLKKEGKTFESFKSIDDMPVSPENFSKLAFLVWISQED
jgi:hypothetical protein